MVYNTQYWSGVAAASLILLLLTYPLKKNYVRAIKLRLWLDVHAVLGTLCVLCVLVHTRLHLTSLNASIATILLLTIGCSGHILHRTGSLRIIHAPLVYLLIICIILHIYAIYAYV